MKNVIETLQSRGFIEAMTHEQELYDLGLEKYMADLEKKMIKDAF